MRLPTNIIYDYLYFVIKKIKAFEHKIFNAEFVIVLLIYKKNFRMVDVIV